MKKALITGVCGQDGSHLAEYLLSLGYEVHGITRGMTYENFVKGVTYHIADMRDVVTLENAFRKAWPDELYNLAGQVFVPTSWNKPEETFDINVNGLARLFRIIEGLKEDTRLYQASSSEMFGNAEGSLNERSPMQPMSPYGASKHAAHELVRIYRNRGYYAVSGILFNHEGPRRGEHMVTRKITRQVAKWALGDKSMLKLGNGSAARDWGYAGDYVKAMFAMMQQDEPDDYVVGTGQSKTVNEFLMLSVQAAGLKWNDVKDYVRQDDQNFVRKNEIHYLRADASKAHIVLGWKPHTTFEQLVSMMVKTDIEREQKRIRSGLEVAK